MNKPTRKDFLSATAAIAGGYLLGGDRRAASAASPAPSATQSSQQSALKDQIAAFLREHKGHWHDYNVPYEDGAELERLVVENSCTRVLEIGTSTGHSTIWLAKGVLRTGGRVTTLEIDRGRHEQALRNFQRAGASHLIQARLGDAMQVLPTLAGPFDFVFSDATWSTQPADGYTRFFDLLEPKLVVGGLYTMHNVTDGYGDDGRFFRHLDELGRYKTRIIKKSSAGISVSKKLRAGNGGG